ncbi:MAG: DNA repair protein RecN, partial [Gammaproteobacteria bacterium]|nr:DNA repair protein RecN [Gammaproteobacteria bacterium]
NPGQPPAPLSRVASGGELSRINLAIQVAATASRAAPTQVFDEVDAGVGGAVAEMVGRRLRELAAGRQVLCVTHLPQVATLAGHQVSVAKATKAGRTTTTVRRLTDAERVDETARMLGGVKITDQTRAHAEEMLAAGRKAHRRRR